MGRTEVLKYLLLSLFSIILIFTSLIGIVGYLSLDFAAELIKELFSGVTVFSSRLFFTQFALLGLTAIFIHWTAILGLGSKGIKPVLWPSFLGSVLLLVLNGYCVLVNGFKWMGYEFFRGQSMADNRVFLLTGIAYFTVVFSMTAITGSMIFQKGEKSETKE
ncbi:MAG: hypothetical protein U9N62_01935 [Thermotogota bacterium]|nr:hypothetical protein [Thermotogota bacterium]